MAKKMRSGSTAAGMGGTHPFFAKTMPQIVMP